MKEELKDFFPHCKVEENKVTINLKKFVDIYFVDNENKIVKIKIHGKEEMLSNDNEQTLTYKSLNELALLVNARINIYARKVEELLKNRIIVNVENLGEYVKGYYSARTSK